MRRGGIGGKKEPANRKSLQNGIIGEC